MGPNERDDLGPVRLRGAPLPPRGRPDPPRPAGSARNTGHGQEDPPDALDPPLFERFGRASLLHASRAESPAAVLQSSFAVIAWPASFPSGPFATLRGSPARWLASPLPRMTLFRRRRGPASRPCIPAT